MQLPSFLLPANGQATPEMVARKRRLADALMSQGIDTSPVESPWQAVGRIGQAAIGGYTDYLAGQQENQGRQGASEAMAALLSSDSAPDNAAIIGAMNNPFLTDSQSRIAQALLENNIRPKEPIKMGKEDVLLDPKTYQPIYQAPSAAQGGGLFDSKSVEGQALNYLIQTGKLTPEQAAQIGAGKPITGADGSMHFLTPQDIVAAAQAASQQPQQDQPNGQVPQAGIPLGPPKKTESEIKGEAIQSGSNVSAQHLTAGATPENPAPGADAAGTAWNSAMQLYPSVGRWLMTGEGQASYDDLFNIAQNYTYALSGQQAPDSEVQRNLNLILPSYKDKPEAVRAKKERLMGFLQTIDARAQGPGSQVVPPPVQQQQQSGGQLSVGATATNPQTGEKIIWNGQSWVPQQ